jgi:hypothetical protein
MTRLTLMQGNIWQKQTKIKEADAAPVMKNTNY